MSIEESNRQLREGIENLNYSTIQLMLTKCKMELFEPSLLHYAVQSGQIDIVAIFVENSKIK